MLAAVIVVTAVARVWLINHCAEPDSDAAGHLGIARAVLQEPLRVDLHWVWPPGYHFFLAGLLALGVTDQGVRLLDCALAGLLPILVWGYGERMLPPAASTAARLAPFLAAVFCGAMPIVNLLGTSAQQETLFTIVVLATAAAIDTRRYLLGGVLLAVATMIRYEAFGAVALFVGFRFLGAIPPLMKRMPAGLARACRLPLSVVVPSIVTVAAWFVAHRLSDGTWFGFLREIVRYTGLQRDTFHQDQWTQLLWFPVTEPYLIFGLTLPLFALGLWRSWRAGFIVPLGIYVFLLASYTSKCALGSARYYESLTPFVCIAAANGVAVIGERARWLQPVVFGAALWHVSQLLLQTYAWTFHV